MSAGWSFLSKDKNRQLLSWVGSGLVALAAGAWAVVSYVWPAHDGAKTVCAQQGVVVGGNVSGSTVINTVTGLSVGAPCAPTNEAKK